MLAALALLQKIGHFGTFSCRVAWRALTPPWNYRELTRHTWQIASRCIGPVLATTFPFGMVITLQGLSIFDLFGAQRMLPSLVTTAIVRELSPLLASVLIAAQGGSSYAAELGAMRIKEELDATEVMAVDSLRWHVVPRVLALILACPILQVFGAMTGILGGYLMAVGLEGEPSGTFIANLWNFTTPLDLYSGLIKTVIFGAIIGLIACFQGFYATGGAAGVGVAVNDTVVQSVLAVFAANYFLTSALAR
jgi:phospholipid/cholesterol/gamma-HCH transport system permease protein